MQAHGELKCVLAPVQQRVVPAAQPCQQQLQHPAALRGVLLPARQQELAQQRHVLNGEGRRVAAAPISLRSSVPGC